MDDLSLMYLFNFLAYPLYSPSPTSNTSFVNFLSTSLYDSRPTKYSYPPKHNPTNTKPPTPYDTFSFLFRHSSRYS